MLIVWGFGIPLSAFGVLFKNRKRLDDIEVRKYYLMIYQGFKNDRFYWEFFNTARKIMILSINVFLSTESLFYRVLLNTILLVFFFRLQLKLVPYKYYLNNILERAEITAGAFTLFGGMLFISEEDEVAVFNVIIFIAIMIVNFYFIAFWLYCMLWTFKDTHRSISLITSLLAMALRIEETNNFDPIVPPRTPKQKGKKGIIKIIKRRIKASESTKKSAKRKRKNAKVTFKEDKKPNSSNLSHSMLKYMDNSVHQEDKGEIEVKNDDWDDIFKGREKLIVDENEVKDNFKIRYTSKQTEGKVESGNMNGDENEDEDVVPDLDAIHIVEDEDGLRFNIFEVMNDSKDKSSENLNVFDRDEIKKSFNVDESNDSFNMKFFEHLNK